MLGEKENEIENDEDRGAVDETADKAAAIGKEMGADKDEVPDYDVQEESDERIAKTRDKAESVSADRKERRELSNKEKRDLRKKRVREKFGEKDAIIAEQQRQLDALTQRTAQMEGRLSGVDKNAVEAALADSVKVLNAATQQHTDAFREGDGDKATKAMREMYEAQKRIDQLQNMKQQLDRQPQQMQTRQEPAFAPEVINQAKAWVQRNPWYKQGENEDSDIAMAISGRLVKEGFDAKDSDFWDELDERLAKKLPHLTDDRQEEDDEPEQVEQKPRKRAAPPIGGGANRGDIKGKVAVQVSTEFINTLKREGLWEDKSVRDKQIHAHLKWKRENQEARQ